MTTATVIGCRVLVVEDETLIAISIEDVLMALECKIVGSTGKLETAIQLAKEADFDVALLDVSIRGGSVYPVAEQLLSRGIPFAFMSGYSDWALPEEMRDQPRLKKPFVPAELEEQVRILYGRIPKHQPMASGPP